MKFIFGNFTLLSAIFDLILNDSYRTCELSIDQNLKTTQVSDVKEVILLESKKFLSPWIVSHLSETTHHHLNVDDQNLNVFLVKESRKVGLNTKNTNSKNVILLLEENPFFVDGMPLSVPGIRRQLEHENTEMYHVDGSLRARRISCARELPLPHSVRSNQIINYHGGTINVTFDAVPPNSYLILVHNAALFTGADAFVLCEILIKLNATPTYYNKMYSARLQKLGNKPVNKEKLLKWLDFHSAGIHHVFDKKMIDYLFVKNTKPLIPELRFTSSHTLTNGNGPMDSLYPHDKLCLVAMHQRETRTSAFLKQIGYSLETKLFISTLIIFWVGRIFIRKTDLKDWFSILFSTVSVYLVQNSISKTKNAFEQLWILVFMIFSIFMLALLAGRIFSNLVENPNSEPMDLSELMDSGMDIWIMEFYRDFFESWPKFNRTKIRNRISYVPPEKMLAGITSSVKAAFILQEDRANALMTNIFSEILNIIEPPLHCGLASYQIAKNSPITERVNEIIRSMIENGVFNAYTSWSELSLARVRSALNEDSSPLTFSSMSGIFYMYFVGIAISLFVFLCELMVRFV